MLKSFGRKEVLLLAVFILAIVSLNAIRPSAQAQTPDSPREFAPGIVSTGHEFGIAFAPDGKEVYFSRFATGQPTHILHARLVNGVWQTPELISFSEKASSDLDPFVSQDGKRLFFISTRPHQNGSTAKPGMDLWVADRIGSGWKTPQPIENVSSESKEGSPSVAHDGTLYFFSDRQRSPNNNAIYQSRFVAGRYTAPVLLSSEINSGSSDTSPFISSNGKMLLFYSTRPGGFGKADIYVSFRKNRRWTPAVNLGPAVNSAESEYNPALSPDGRQLFFGRNSRIYVIPRSSIAALKNISLR